jgi:hypothetical protein
MSPRIPPRTNSTARSRSAHRTNCPAAKLAAHPSTPQPSVGFDLDERREWYHPHESVHLPDAPIHSQSSLASPNTLSPDASRAPIDWVYPKSFRKRVHRYLSLLATIRSQFPDVTDAATRVGRHPRHVAGRLNLGPEQLVARILGELLSDQAMRAVANNNPIPRRGDGRGHFVPMWTRTRMSPIGFDYHLYTRLNRRNLLAVLTNDPPVLKHVVLKHMFIPEGTALRSVWEAMRRLDVRFRKFWRKLQQSGAIVAAFAVRHFDVVRHQGVRGILLHIHILAQIKPTMRFGRPELKHWENSARGNEIDETPWSKTSGGPDASPDEIENLFLYVGRTVKARGFRFARFMLEFRNAPADRYARRSRTARRQHQRNGTTTAKQLLLMLAAATYPAHDYGLLGDWDGRTKGGKVFFARLDSDK